MISQRPSIKDGCKGYIKVYSEFRDKFPHSKQLNSLGLQNIMALLRLKKYDEDQYMHVYDFPRDDEEKRQMEDRYSSKEGEECIATISPE